MSGHIVESEQQEQVFNKYETKAVISVFSYFNFGSDPCGIYGATPFEMLHVFYLSLMLYLLLATFEYTSASDVLQAWFSCRCKDKHSGHLSLKPSIDGESNKGLANCAKFRNRICLVLQVVTWQSDCLMPKMPFNNGVTGLTQLAGQEYPGLCLLTMLSIDGLLGNASIEKSFAKLLWLSLSLEKLLTEFLQTTFTLEDLMKKIKVHLHLFRQMVGIHHERSSSCGLQK